MTRSRLLPLVALFLLLALAVPAPRAGGRRASSAGVAGAVPATLVEVIDGDTIDVLVNDKVERVRYVSIDTPECSQSGYLACKGANMVCNRYGAAEMRARVANGTPGQNSRQTVYGALVIDSVGKVGRTMNTT